MKKKILTLALVAALSATAAIGGTLAYFTDTTQTANNVFTVGNVKIKLEEKAWEDHGKAEAEDVYAGESLDKDPTVTNTGKNPCFVRVKVENLDQFERKFQKGNIVYLTNWEENKLGEGWVDGGDDFFYWTKPLRAENDTANEDLSNVTTKLFEQIKMPTGLTGDEAADPIVVSAQAVQAQGAKAKWADVKKMTVEEIKAWFNTCLPDDNNNNGN